MHLRDLLHLQFILDSQNLLIDVIITPRYKCAVHFLGKLQNLTFPSLDVMKVIFELITCILKRFDLTMSHFSSPELKAQVSFSDHLSSVVCLFVCLSVHLFHILLQNHWANFNQTWHKASLGEGDSSLFK